MRIGSTANSKFHCDHTRIAPDAECHRMGIGLTDLENAVFGMIQKQARASADIVSPSASDAGKSAIAECGRKAERLADEKRGLYERLILGELTAEDYKAAKTELDGELTRLASANAALTAETAERMKAVKSKELATMIGETDSLTDRLAGR